MRGSIIIRKLTGKLIAFNKYDRVITSMACPLSAAAAVVLLGQQLRKKYHSFPWLNLG